LIALSLGAFLTGGLPARAATIREEPIEAPICRLIETAARAQDLPVAFLTRLIWQESSFRTRSVSPSGAQGIAQFMPGTAQERGLADPFDPEEAIPKAAELLGALRQRFGNLGLAAAAYNAGPGRLESWRTGKGFLPAETRRYVQRVTGHPIEDFLSTAAVTASPPLSCLKVTASIRRSEAADFAGSALLGPWGVQLAGNFSKAAALAAYARARHRFAALLGPIEPMIVGGRLLNRGFRPFYRVRAPAPSRAAANSLCAKILRAGGACVVLRS
jgi:hypothetical protein